MGVEATAPAAAVREGELRTVGIVMNGVTGRMGYHQHLVRSILAIREQGGVAVAGRHDDLARAGPGRPQRGQARARSPSGTALERWTTDLDAALADPSCEIYFDAQVTTARAEACGGRSPPASTSTARSPSPTDLDGALELARLARDGRRQARRRAGQAVPARPAQAEAAESTAASSAASCPCAASSATGSSRATGSAAQRPSWNYRAEDGGGIIVDMFPHWRYVLDELFGAGAVRAHARRHPHPRALGRDGQGLRRHRRRRRLRDLRARGRRSSPRSTPPGRAGLPRRAGRVPGRRHRRQRRRRPARLPRPAARATPKPVWNPDIARPDRLPRPVAGGAGQRRVRQRLQGPVGAVPAARRRRRARSRWDLLEGAKGVQLAELGLQARGRGRRCSTCRSSTL